MENKTIEITVGMQASGWYFTDVYPYEVIKVTPSGKTVTVREMDASPAEGYDYFSNQMYDYTSNPNGRTYTVRKTKYGWKTPGGLKVSFGSARKYQDPHV